MPGTNRPAFGRRPRSGTHSPGDPFSWALLGDGSQATLDIDFVNNRAKNGATAPAIASLLSCARATPAAAYYTKADGTLITFPANTLRYGTNGLLVEESRVNVCLQSQTMNTSFDTAGGFANNGCQDFSSGSLANAVAAPDGTTTAEFICENANSSNHSIQLPSITTSVQSYTLSVYAKAETRSRLVLHSLNADAKGLGFDLSNGTTFTPDGVGAPASSNIEALANGWYRCAITFTGAVATNNIGAFYLINSGTATNYQGNGTSGLYLWGTQLEAGAFATSYIPTTTVAVTRAADVVSFADVAWFNATQGTIYSQALSAPVNGAQVLFESAVDAAGADLLIQYRSTANPQFDVVSATVTVATLDAGTWATDTLGKIASAYAANDFASSFNSGAAATDTSGAVPAAALIARIGTRAVDGSLPWNSYIKRFAYWPSRLSNAALQALTA